MNRIANYAGIACALFFTLAIAVGVNGNTSRVAPADAVVPMMAQQPPLLPDPLLADGSDPMPLCRQKGCGPFKLADEAALSTPDGGPIPMCPPCRPGGTKNCGPDCSLK
jgi:hypothetical protein